MSTIRSTAHRIFLTFLFSRFHLAPLSARRTHNRKIHMSGSTLPSTISSIMSVFQASVRRFPWPGSSLVAYAYLRYFPVAGASNPYPCCFSLFGGPLAAEDLCCLLPPPLEQLKIKGLSAPKLCHLGSFSPRHVVAPRCLISTYFCVANPYLPFWLPHHHCLYLPIPPLCFSCLSSPPFFFFTGRL